MNICDQFSANGILDFFNKYSRTCNVALGTELFPFPIQVGVTLRGSQRGHSGPNFLFEIFSVSSFF